MLKTSLEQPAPATTARATRPVALQPFANGVPAMSTTRRTQEWPALAQTWPPPGRQHLLLTKAKT
eukprot:1197443-Pyramimonas_sp.AAC.1